MSRVARWVGVAAVAVILTSGGSARAAIATSQAFSSVYTGQGFPGTLSYTVNAGTNRMLVVGVSSSISAAVTQTCTVTFGGQTLTQQIGDGGTSAQQHTWLFYLKDTPSVMNGAAQSLVVTVTGGTSRYNYVYAAVYAGVDQSATPVSSSQSFNSGATTSTTVGPFATALTIGTGETAVEMVNLTRTGGTTARTITFAAPWSSALGPNSFSDTTNTMAFSTYAAVDTTAGSTASQYTASSNTLSSMAAMSLKVAAAGGTISIGQVADPTNTVTSGGTAAIDAFSVQTSTGSATLQNVTVTLGSPAGLSGVFLYSNSSCTTGGTQYGATIAPGTSTSVTFSNANVPAGATAATLYVCGTGATVASSTSVTAAVASATTSTSGYTVNASTDTAGTLTVQPLVTIGNGSPEVTSSSITAGAVGPIDAFSVQSSGGTATLSAVTVNLTVSAGTPLSNVFVNSQSSCAGTTYGTLASPAAGANTITLGTSITATTSSGTTNLYVCGTAATVAANATVTATVTAATASGYGSTSNDTSSGTLTVTPPPSVTIGNGSPEATSSSIGAGAAGPIDAFSLQTSAGTASVGSVTVNLTFSAGTPLSNVFVNSLSSCAGTTYGTLASPAAGANTIALGTTVTATTSSGTTNLYVCGTGATVAANATVTGTVSSVAAIGYVSSSSDTGSATLTVTAPPTITVGNGSAEPANASVAAGVAGAIDAFSLQTNGNTATVTAVTVNLSFSAGAPLANVFVNALSSCAGTTYGTLASPTAGANTIPLATSLAPTATSGSTNLYVCGTAATVAASATVTGTVSSVTAAGYASTSSDTTSATLTVTPPPGTTTGTVTATVSSCSQIAVSASYTGDGDGDNTVTFSRSTDGTTFTTLTGCTNVGGGVNPRACADGGLAASTSYWYRAQFTDATGGVAGTNPITTSASVNTGACPANLVLSSPGTQPAGGTLTVGGATWTYVGQLALAASANTLTLDSIAIANAATASPATNGDLTLNLLNSAGTAVDSTARWDGSKWVFASILDGSTGLPIVIGTTAVTFRVYATANYGAAAGESFQMQVAAANVAAVAPATATTGATVTGNAFTIAAPAAVAEGSLADTASPMVSIVNPEKGKIVNGAFLVDVYVYSANGTAITAKALTTDGSTPTCAADDATLARTSHAYANAKASMYSKTLSLGIGTYTLRACAKNGTGTAVVSAPVAITVRAAGAGDGNLLVRDNASQLCSDCHDQNKLRTHSSESTSTATAPSKYGSWATSCRDCHTPHSTRNLYLVREQIVPPGVNGYQPTKNVYFANKTGDSNVSGATTPASSSFANSDNSGPCQACHTRTMDPSRTYTTGTFTGGSTGVTSTAAVFKTGSAPSGDVGNYIFAPDGRSYLISAVPTTSSATLSTAYAGATTGSGTAKFLVGPARWRNSGNGDTLHATASAGTSACTNCHSHKGGFGAAESPGGTNCSGCHAKIWSTVNGATTGIVSKHTLGNVAGTNDSFNDDATVNWGSQTSLANVAATQRSCVNMCHDDHVHDLSPATTHEQDVYTDARTSTSRAMTRDASGNVSGGTPAKTDFSYNATTQAWGGMCTSCHQTQVDASRPAVTASTFSGSGHDGVTSSDGTNTYTWSYTLHDGSTFNRNCTKCHASRAEGTTPTSTASGSGTVAVHGTTDPSLLSGTKNPAGAANGAGYVCYNCHGTTATLPAAAGAQGNRSKKDIQAQIAHATTTGQSGHPTNADSVHDSVAEQSGAAFGNALGNKARHVNCLDCHDAHQAKAGVHAAGKNVAGSPLQGVFGAQLSTSPAFWTAPTSASFTKKTIVAGTDLEATLCFKCHSSFYGTLPTTPSGTFAETDTAKEFNPNNVSSGSDYGSFHPVLATAGSNRGAIYLANLVTTNIAWSTTARNLMTCSDCHASDVSTDPRGPHGSAAKFILRGPNTAWNNTLALVGNAMPAGTFCANCHSPTYVSSRFPDHTNSVHANTPCMNCHTAIPHGGPRPGLLNIMATSGTPVTPRKADYDGAAGYAQPGTGSTLGISSYPASNTTNWANNNCGCGSSANGH